MNFNKQTRITEFLWWAYIFNTNFKMVNVSGQEILRTMKRSVSVENNEIRAILFNETIMRIVFNVIRFSSKFLQYSQQIQQKLHEHFRYNLAGC